MSSATIERPIGYAHPTVSWNGLTVTDLFCGAGGSSSGLVEAGYRVVIAANHGNAMTPNGPIAWENRSGSESATNTHRSLTHSLDYGKEGLAVNATRTCSIDGCFDPHKGHGLCNRHLIRLRHTGTTDSFVRSLETRFWAKVDKRGPDECWPWTAATNENGYGVIRPAGKRTGPTVKAHRVSAELAGMDIDGLDVLHSCDNPPCVNPAHLRPGMDADNVADKMARNRQSKGSGIGTSKLTEAAVIEIRAALAAGETHLDIAERFGVSRPTVTFISTGKTWRHVTPPCARDLGFAVAEFLLEEELEMTV